MTNRSAQGYIGPNLVVRGRLSGEGTMQVDGRLEGDVAVRGELFIGDGGVVKAAVAAEHLVVDGQVRGNVVADEEVQIRSGGFIDGDVRAPRIAIDDGGSLHGGVEMDFDVPEPSDERDDR